jgi:hypothetical protein
MRGVGLYTLLVLASQFSAYPASRRLGYTGESSPARVWQLRSTFLGTASGSQNPPHNLEPIQQGDTLSCKILATTRPWNPPGVMDVFIDGNSIGSFKFGPNGSDELAFACTEGNHSFTFSVENTNISCSASFSVTSSKTTFSPMMWVAPNGAVTCGLQ